MFIHKDVRKNGKEAFEFHKISVEQGNINSKFQLGYCYDEGIGTDINKVKAFDFRRKIYLGYYYVNGIGTEAAGIDRKANILLLYKSEFHELFQSVCKNKVKAFEFYKKSADQGFINAQCKLGQGNVKRITSLYEQGKGTEKYIENAIYWYKKAENGYKESEKKA
ncbi:hypothetical protein C1645_823300 [Glomus cerebriforme]|uniref:Uncharacterized protein n=1 Tax=Glomus cerebriforme TaxID=658196 RepID=A0A397SWP0_9GLOM|nr:hypothetical protein C1645_823300 [Glomus cerebriforme]